MHRFLLFIISELLSFLGIIAEFFTLPSTQSALFIIYELPYFLRRLVQWFSVAFSTDTFSSWSVNCQVILRKGSRVDSRCLLHRQLFYYFWIATSFLGIVIEWFPVAFCTNTFSLLSAKCHVFLWNDIGLVTRYIQHRLFFYYL